MVYLDYSATTPVNDEVLETFNKVTKEYFGNSNSLHKLGSDADRLINESTKIICNFLKIKTSELIYTSGATESNNLAVKGVIEAYPSRAKRIITTKLEHSSIKKQMETLKKKGYEIEYLNLLEDGTVDLNHLKSLLQKDAILVTISMVDSELGIRQPIEEIGKILKNYPKVIFHTDITQALGKVNFDLTNVDLASFSGHKIYAIKGIGGLVKKENINLFPQIEGGKSTTIFRSGTPQTSLIASLAKAFKLINYDLDKSLNEMIITKLKEYDVHINSTSKSIPHIINFSIPSIKSETFVHALDEEDIYISSKTACSVNEDMSESVYAVTKDELLSKRSLRVSLSYLTTKEEVNRFLTVFDKCYQELNILK
jgi:cysteine desulfurase